jgi:hypothetical protein
MRPMRRLDVVHEDATMRQAYCGNVQIAVWYDAPTLEQMLTYGRCAQGLYTRWHGMSALVNVVVAGTPRFSSDVREVAIEYTREGAHKVGAAHVILIGGLLGSSARAFLSTMILVGRPPNPTRVFGNLDDAARWLAKNLNELSPERWDAAELASVCRAAVERDGNGR